MKEIVFLTALCILAVGFVENATRWKIPFKKSASQDSPRSVDSENSVRSEKSARSNKSVDSNKSDASNRSKKSNKSKSSNHSNKSDQPSTLSKLARSLAGRFKSDLTREEASAISNHSNNSTGSSQTNQERTNTSTTHFRAPLLSLPEKSQMTPPHHEASQTSSFAAHARTPSLSRQTSSKSSTSSAGSVSGRSAGSVSGRSARSSSSTGSARSTRSTSSVKTKYSILSKVTDPIKVAKNKKRSKLRSNSTSSERSTKSPSLGRNDSVKSFTRPSLSSSDSQRSTKSEHAKPLTATSVYSPFANEFGISKSKHGSLSSKSTKSRLSTSSPTYSEQSVSSARSHSSSTSNSSSSGTNGSGSGKLKFALEHVLMTVRHGQRTPFEYVPIFVSTHEQLEEIYGNEPFGGALTPKGFKSMFNLGRKFRQRYGTFLTPHNKVHPSADIRVTSTGVDRSRLSARAFVNGLYFPDGENVTNHIPDNIVDPGSLPWCERLRREQDMIFNFMDTDLDDNLTDWFITHLGEKTVEQYSVFNIVDNIFAEAGGGFKHPAWVDMKKLKLWKYQKFALNTATETALRLKAGPMLKYMLWEFSQIMQTRTRPSKMSVFGSHDDSVQAIVASLNVKWKRGQTYLDTDYGCAIIFELYSARDPITDELSFYIQVLYSKNTKMQMEILQINGCNRMCSAKKFVQLLEARGVIPFYWREECDNVTPHPSEASEYSTDSNAE